MTSARSPSQQYAQNQPQTLTSHVVVCGTARSIKDTEAALLVSQTIFVDCEGVNLGVYGGTLSILSLGVIPRDSPQSLNIYLIDVSCLSRALLSPIFDVLMSPKVTKVLWDGRMDYSALYHGFGVRMRNVIDLQVVDILSRESRDTPEQHLQRFSGYVRANLLRGSNSRRRYAGLHRLNSLLCAVKEHRPARYKQFKKDKVDHRVWEAARPLPAEYIKYAATDIEMIAALYITFRSRRYIHALNITSLTAKCSRYVTFWEDRQPRIATVENYFKGNAFLPLEIIDVDDSSDKFALRFEEKKRKCKHCDRLLTEAAFPSPEAAPVECPYGCWVCVAVAENSSYWKQRSAASAKRKARQALKPTKSVIRA